MCHPRFVSGGLCQSKITEMTIITRDTADTVRKHIMFSISKPVLSVLKIQMIITVTLIVLNVQYRETVRQ